MTAVRVATKIAWEAGELTYLNQSGCWNREHRAFALTRHAHPGLVIDLPADEGTRTLITAYFDRYGPATIKDAMWWSALSRTAILAAMRQAPAGWVEVTTPWSRDPAYLPDRRYQQFLDADPGTQTTGLNLLAHEDVALKAYFNTRTRYLHRLQPQAAFNQIGEALPTILIDGRVHGTWAWNPTSRAVTATLALGSSRWERRIATATDRLTTALRAGWLHHPPDLRKTAHPQQLALAL